MALSSRQSALYGETFDCWRETETIAVSGEVTGSSWAKVLSAQPCYLESGKSYQTPDGFLVDEQDNQFTVDFFHMEDGIDVRNGDVLKATSGKNSGDFYRVRGEPQIRNRRANKQIVATTRCVPAPPGVS